MNRLKKLLKNRNGMTLVEIMTGFAILSVVMVISLSIMLFSSNVLSEDSRRNRVKMLGDEMYTAVSDKLIFATHIQLLPEGSAISDAKYEKVIFVKDGRLYTGPREGPYTLFYAEAVYQGTALAMTADVPDRTILSLSLTFSRSGQTKPAYETGSSFQIINLATGMEQTAIEGAGTFVNPVISYDEVPYWQDEEEPPYNSDAPYTVAQYPIGQTIIDITDPRQPMEVKAGAFYRYNGILWQAVRDAHYNGDKAMEPGQPGNNLWKSLEENWDVVSSGNSAKCVYEYHDVVMLDNIYYMSVYAGSLNAERPGRSAGWRRVYWFKEEATAVNPMLGWSTTESTYTCALKEYP